jgi:hypothetical protein
MFIRFERTLEDLIAFNDFHYRHSQSMKKYLFWYRWIGALFILLLPPLIMQSYSPDMPLFFELGLSLIGAIIFAVNAERIVHRRIRKQALKLYKEGNNEALLGESVLELTDTGLLARSPLTETKLAWGAIERIETNSDYTFLYIGSVNAYVIPHNRIIEGDYRAFMAEVGRRFQPGQKLPLSS